MARRDRTSKQKQTPTPQKNTLPPSRPFTDNAAQQETTLAPKVDDSTQSFDFSQIEIGQLSEPIQAKLTIGEPGDKYEQEADNVAKSVVRQINSPQSAQREEEEVQRSSLGVGFVTQSPVQRQSSIPVGQANDEFESNLNQARNSGTSLEPKVQLQMESAMGADFSGVKIHTDAQADQLSRSIQARAFTTGSDVFFKQGEYNPSSPTGQELLAHELTHVVQQTGTVSRSISQQTIQRDVAVNSLANARSSILALAKQCGYEGDESDETAMREFITLITGYSDEEIDEQLSLYQEADLSQDKTERLNNLEIPDELDHTHLEQDPGDGACRASSSIAGLLLQDASKLQSVLQDGSQPDFATFKFPPATALASYTEHSEDTVQEALRNIIQAHNNVYRVPKTVYKGDLLPNTEPWVNLLLQAVHQHIQAAGFGQSDSYNIHVPLTVKEDAEGEAKQITFNLLTAEVGESKTGQAVAGLTDEDLKGKKLQIGHGGHATILVVNNDGSKVYYDNQNGKEDFDANTTVEDILKTKGFDDENTSIIIE